MILFALYAIGLAYFAGFVHGWTRDKKFDARVRKADERAAYERGYRRGQDDLAAAVLT